MCYLLDHNKPEFFAQNFINCIWKTLKDTSQDLVFDKAIKFLMTNMIIFVDTQRTSIVNIEV